MSDHMVRFIGHIDERKRPENFPREIYADIFFRVETNQDLKEKINGVCAVFLTQQCMIVPKDPSAIESAMSPKQDSRMVVPMHMITHVTTETKKLSVEIPMVIEDGTAELSDGTKVRIQ